MTRRCVTCGELVADGTTRHDAPACRVPRPTMVRLDLRLTERDLRAIASTFAADRRDAATLDEVRQWATDNLIDALDAALFELEARQTAEP